MKRRFRNFDEGGEVDEPRRRGFLRDSQGNLVRSGTGEPVRTRSEYSYEDYRHDNPQQVQEDEEKAKQTAAEIRQRMQRAADQVRPPAAPQSPAGQAQVFAPLGGVPPASSQIRPPGAMPPSGPPQPAAMPPAGMPPPRQMGDASVAEEMAQRGPQAAPPTPAPPTPAPPTPAPRPQIAKPKTPMAVSSGRGKAAGKTAEQEMQSILDDKKRQQERERIKKMEREQALEGVYPEMAIPALRGMRALAGMGSGKAATKAAPKAARPEPKVPSDLGAKPRAERSFANEARTGSKDPTAEPARTGGRELARQAESGSKAVAKRAEPAPAKIAERAKDSGFVPGERRALEGRKPGQLQEARQGESRREIYMGPVQEVRRELPKPATKEPPKLPGPKKTPKEPPKLPGPKKTRKGDDDDPMGRWGWESPSFMKKGGMVRRGDGIAQRGKTRGKYI